MHAYRVTITAQIAPMSTVVERRLRLAGASVTVLAVDVVTIALSRRARDAQAAADAALLAVTGALGTSARMTRPPVWVARRRGPLALLGVTAGRGTCGDDPDDGVAGVREPRRPHPPAGSAAAAIDVDAA